MAAREYLDRVAVEERQWSGETFRRLMEEHGYTKEGLAHVIGGEVYSPGVWCKDGHAPALLRARRVAAAFGMTTDELIETCSTVVR